MRAVVLKNNEIAFTTEYPLPEPSAGEALVKVSLAGICNTDLELTKGYMGFSGVLGHEFVGTVIGVNSSNKKENDFIGKRVVGEINIPCRVCETCRNMPKHCPSRKVLGISQKDGAFADYLTLPVSNLHVVPDEVPDEEAVFTEPLAACLEVLEQLKISPSNSVAIIGDGKVGLLMAQLMADLGHKTSLIGKHEDRFLIVEEFGVETYLPGQMNEKVDIVIECTGSKSGINDALSLVRSRGTVVVKSTFYGLGTLDTSKVVVNEITIVGSRCGPFEPALRILAQKRLDTLSLIEKKFPIEQAKEAFDYARGKLKVLLTF